MPALTNALRFSRVAYRFDAVKVLEDITLDVPDGAFVSIVGPSGCGKSTLLNLACGMLTPSHGAVKMYGEPVNGIAQGVGYVFQSDALLPWKTALDNVGLALLLQRRPPAEIVARATDWIQRVGLSGFEQHLPSQLSGGMRKRVAIAQALVHDPRLVFMDEPFSALDVQTRTVLQGELLRIWEENRRTVVFVTHDLDEAIALSDRVVVLSARPSRVKACYNIDLPRPRSVAGLRLHPRFQAIYATIWGDLEEAAGARAEPVPPAPPPSPSPASGARPSSLAGLLDGQVLGDG